MTDNFNVVKVVLTHPTAKLPEYAKDGDAGADVYAILKTQRYPQDTVARLEYYTSFGEKDNEEFYAQGDYLIAPGGTEMIDLGFKIQLEPGWEIQVRSRSGMSKHGLVVANSPGTIDSGYRGPCMVLLHNNTSSWRVIKPGTRVAQFVLKRAPQALFREVDELDVSERGEGGFGSTGTK